MQIDMPTTALTTPRLIPVPHWNDHHEWPPQGGLRHLIFNAKTNGFDRVVKRAGRRVLLDETAFFQWVESQSKVD
ncbi:hypothetical protein [Geoanaerobacter pelophilus]|uniref:hypothetical protein n=1 Tax=Geoanaerobacter pelophilus TaxID=60036 RepID=UPI000A270970|nr:hypothetical protein [Geoanaerobacter pelophilus]